MLIDSALIEYIDNFMFGTKTVVESNFDKPGGYMAEKDVKFETSGPESMRYWLAVDERDVKLTNGVGGLNLDDSDEHILIWWMIGEPGDTLSIEGKAGEKSVVKVKSKIPDGASKGSGFRRFTI